MSYRARVRVVIPAVVLLLGSVVSGAVQLKSIELCTDVTGEDFTAVNAGDAFTAETPAIHGVVRLEGARSGSVLKGVWISIDAISVPDYAIDAAEVKLQKAGRASGHFSLSRPTNGWPVGNYRLDVQVDGQLLGSKRFSIAAPATDQTPPPPAANAPDEIARKLQALEAAHDAGVLSDQEYAEKKALLEAQLQGSPQAPDEETRKKLEALDSAYQAGILNEQEYQQKKSLLLGGTGPARPAEQPPAEVPATEPAPMAAPGARAGRTYTHPAGFSFWYPASWNVTDQDGNLQFVPPDAATSPQGPLELYFLATESIAGQTIREPTDESVVQYLDEQVKSLSPALQYTRQPATLQTKVGKGAVLVWQATAPDGRKITARVFVTFAKETAVMLIGMGLKERIDARDKDLQDIFQSLTTGPVEVPPAPPGTVEAAPAPAQEPPTPPGVPAPEGGSPDPQMKALEAARQAGVLSEEEFAAKRTELEQRRLQRLDGETRKRLEALETAHQTGVLTDEEYGRKRAQLLGQAPAPVATPTTPTSGVTLPAKTDGKTYRHVIGFSFWYPADWTVKELQDTLQLVPPDPGMADGEPTELFFLIGDSVAGQGISRADDPRVAQYMDQALTGIAGFLRRTATPVPKAMLNGRGVVMNWEGTSPAGRRVCARAYVSIINEYGVALVGLCLPERLERRNAVLQRVFASFSFGAGQLDQQLCGKWTYLTTQSMTNWSPFETSYSRAQMASDTTGTLVLQPDGAWTRTDRTQMLAGAAGVWLESDQTKVNKGRWYAGGGSLYLIWEDNSWEDYKYEIRRTADGVRLLLVSGQKGELWEKAN